MTQNSRKIEIQIILIFILGCLLITLYYENFNYLDLDVPIPSSNPSNEGWDKVLHVAENNVGEYYRTLVLRKEVRLYDSTLGERYDSSEEIFAYFTNFLAQEGWTLVPLDRLDILQCQNGFPEKLYIVDAQYQEYVKNGVSPEASPTKICVVVIDRKEVSSEGKPQFDVIFISSRLSFLTAILETFRHW